MWEEGPGWGASACMDVCVRVHTCPSVSVCARDHTTSPLQVPRAPGLTDHLGPFWNNVHACPSASSLTSHTITLLSGKHFPACGRPEPDLETTHARLQSTDSPRLTRPSVLTVAGSQPLP